MRAAELEGYSKVGKQGLDLESSGLEPVGKLERVPEIVGWLVDCESGPIGRDLEENTARLAEVNRLEIIAVKLGSDIVAQLRQLGSNFHLLPFVAATERNVMHRTCSHPSGPNARHTTQINDSSGAAGATRVSKDAALLAHQSEAEHVGEELSGELIGVEPEGYRVQAADGVLSRHTSG